VARGGAAAPKAAAAPKPSNSYVQAPRPAAQKAAPAKQESAPRVAAYQPVVHDTKGKEEVAPAAASSQKVPVFFVFSSSVFFLCFSQWLM
jgi:hypothetical protein